MSIKVAWAVNLLYNIQRRRTCEQHKRVDAADDASVRLVAALQIHKKSK